MRTITAIVTLNLLAGAASAQQLKESEVPAPIVKTFHDSYKNAKAKSWEKEKNGMYEVEFNWEQAEHSVTFSSAGQILWTEVEISAKDLPQAAGDYLNSNYPGYKTEEIKRSSMPTGDNTYKVEIKKGKEELEIRFDGNGNFVSKEQD